MQNSQLREILHVGKTTQHSPDVRIDGTLHIEDGVFIGKTDDTYKTVNYHSNADATHELISRNDYFGIDSDTFIAQYGRDSHIVGLSNVGSLYGYSMYQRQTNNTLSDVIRIG